MPRMFQVLSNKGMMCAYCSVVEPQDPWDHKKSCVEFEPEPVSDWIRAELVTRKITDSDK